MKPTVKRARRGSLKPKTRPAPSLDTTPTPAGAYATFVDPSGTLKVSGGTLDVATIREAKRQLESVSVPMADVISTHSQASYLSRIIPRIVADKTVSEAVSKVGAQDASRSLAPVGARG